MSFTATAYLFYGVPLSAAQAPWRAEAYEYDYDVWLQAVTELPAHSVANLRALAIKALIGGDITGDEEGDFYLAARASIREISIGGIDSGPKSFHELEVDPAWPTVFETFASEAHVDPLPQARWWLVLKRS